MINLFLDSNIFLDFYRFGDDDLNAIQKLVALINGNEIQLVTNDHLQSEVSRNREKTTAQAIQDIPKKIQFRTPRFCEGMEIAAEINKKIQEANNKIAELQKDVQSKAQSADLRPDHLIRELFNVSYKAEITPQIIEDAKTRAAMGNPPEKPGSIGDAVHWLSLLNATPKLYKLHIVSRDADFRSPLDGTSLSKFLSDEWKQIVGEYSYVSLHTSLSQFLNAKFPDIKLSEETTKTELINQLASSPNFASTHSIIEQLKIYNFFTKSQVSRLFEILVENNQVGWIATDEDVKGLFEKLKSKADAVHYSHHALAAALLEVDEDDWFGIPF